MTTGLRDFRFAKLVFGAVFCAALTAPSFAQQPKFKSINVKTPDGLTISAQKWGNPASLEILFFHGLAQSHMSWMRQGEGELAQAFRIVTYDLRGHGNSDKPLHPAKYKDSKAWGDEVQAVMNAAGLKRRVLVTHCPQDRNAKVGNAQYTASVIKGAKLSVYEGIGHAPCYEDVHRLNSELAAVARSANKAR